VVLALRGYLALRRAGIRERQPIPAFPHRMSRALGTGAEKRAQTAALRKKYAPASRCAELGRHYRSSVSFCRPV